MNNLQQTSNTNTFARSSRLSGLRCSCTIFAIIARPPASKTYVSGCPLDQFVPSTCAKDDRFSIPSFLVVAQRCLFAFGDPDKAISYSSPTLVDLGCDFNIAQLSSCPTRPKSYISRAHLDQIANQCLQITRGAYCDPDYTDTLSNARSRNQWR
ncbi:hypothetical protein BO86DRAFT_7433 [Aspergillus japonicus CBS 114.51]|uniref:Uncharacterized protein n=1 Tax=Aspergillus japonicus CBS 114.51 TaxID=1448312 RepID=A0A8T8XHC7_ASPJA|nr:hypothetical protein BO86DRAFT_7433 [Aspergillus japonicus CBS 114.51]RAH87635.1 hypothetical protein BO86DRAFT_7433 [Aspergillus japonicus CBS 114.51]